MTFRERDPDAPSEALHADEVRQESPARFLARTIVGPSRSMQQVRRRIEALSRAPVPVLVSGESGTGRECVVNALHRLREGPGARLVKISCASPGADAVPPDAPAVYLDEIGDLPAPAQELWLEQIRAAWRDLGSHRPRVYASTSEDLSARARQGSFHAVLAEMLHRRTVVLPPLRERKQDLPVLVSTLLERAAEQCGLPKPRMLPGALARLKECPWRYNVRGLEQVLERLAAYTADGRITAADVEAAFDEDPESVAAHRRERERRERERTAVALERAHGNVKKAAEDLDMTTTAVRSRAQKWGLMPRPKPKGKRRPDPGSGRKQD